MTGKLKDYIKEADLYLKKSKLIETIENFVIDDGFSPSTSGYYKNRFTDRLYEILSFMNPNWYTDNSEFGVTVKCTVIMSGPAGVNGLDTKFTVMFHVESAINKSDFITTYSAEFIATDIDYVFNRFLSLAYNAIVKHYFELQIKCGTRS